MPSIRDRSIACVRRTERHCKGSSVFADGHAQSRAASRCTRKITAMKIIVLCSLLATTAVAVLTTPERTALSSAYFRAPAPAGPIASPGDLHTWEGNEERILADPLLYRQTMMQQLERRGQLLAQMSLRCSAPDFAHRGYLVTRVRALRQQLDYARAECVRLPVSLGDEAFTASHAEFHRTSQGLDGAIVQLADELQMEPQLTNQARTF